MNRGCAEAAARSRLLKGLFSTLVKRISRECVFRASAREKSGPNG